LRFAAIGKRLAEIDAQRGKAHDHGKQQRRHHRHVATPIATEREANHHCPARRHQ
jgi:hypothetical protein